MSGNRKLRKRVAAIERRLNVKTLISELGLSGSHEKQSASRSWKRSMILSSD